MTIRVQSRSADKAGVPPRNPYALQTRRPSRLPQMFLAVLAGIALFFRSTQSDAPATPEADSAGAGALPARGEPGSTVAPPHDLALDMPASDPWGGAEPWADAASRGALRASPGDMMRRPAADAPLADWLRPQDGPAAAAGPDFASLYGAGAGLSAATADLAPGMVRPAVTRADGPPPQGGPQPEDQAQDFVSAAFQPEVPLA